MRLFLLPDSFNGESSFELKDRDFNYIVNVLRMKEGQRLTGRDKNGTIWNLKIETIGKKYCILTSEKALQAEETTDALPQDRPNHNIILYQCLPKGRKLDDIIKKATEIGVLAIVPVNSKNCIAKNDEKKTRYDAIVKEAIQQSGSLIPTEVCSPIDIKDVPEDLKKRCSNGLGIFLHQCKVQENQSSLFNTVYNYKGTVGIIVGAEGGFTDEECSFLLEKGFKAVLLKTNILRCETASIYAISAVQTLLETDC